MPRNSGHFLLIAYLCCHESFWIVSMNRFRSIYLKVQEYYDRLPNEKWKLSFLSALPFWVGSVAVGLVAVFYAQMFQWAEDSFCLDFGTSRILDVSYLSPFFYRFMVGRYPLCPLCIGQRNTTGYGIVRTHPRTTVSKSHTTVELAYYNS